MASERQVGWLGEKVSAELLRFEERKAGELVSGSLSSSRLWLVMKTGHREVLTG